MTPPLARLPGHPLLWIAAVGALLGCGLPANVRYRCETNGSCLQPGYQCGPDLTCYPPEELGSDGGVQDGGGDSGTVDGGGAPDGGSSDAGVTDGGGADGGAPDSGVPDAGGADAGLTDGGLCGNVACLHFDEGDGGTTADATGLNPGTLVNAPLWVTGRIGQALAFNGSSTRVDLGNGPSLHLTGSMSICAWIKPTGLPSGNDDAAIVSKMMSSVRGFQLDTTIDHGPRTIGFKLQDPAGNLMARYGATAVTLNVWHHVAGVYNASAMKMDVYLDGVKDDGVLDGTVTATQLDVVSPVTVGSRSGAPGTFNFNGLIDEVMVFDRPLSGNEITAIFTAAP